MKINLSDRIKNYENCYRFKMLKKTIVIIRLDGRSFSKYTKNLNKPFDDGFSEDMDSTAVYLCENIQGAKFAYTQSDEISIILTDFDNLESEAWFDYNVQKMVSIAASLATAKFNELRLIRKCKNNYNSITSADIQNNKLAMFDARVFQVPTPYEMVNAMILRQQDCTRNSISMAASSCYSHKELEKKSGNEKQEMLFQKGINWNNYAPKYKRGVVIKKVKTPANTPNGELVMRNKWKTCDTPIFTEDKEFLFNLIPKIE